MGRKLLIAAVLVCAVIAPGLAYSQGPATVTAHDFGWTASPGGGTELTVTKTDKTTVEFSYPKAPQNKSAHTVNWTGAKPSCPGVPTGPDYLGGQPGWSAECSFSQAGEYPFVCGVHPEMTGKVIVKAPAATVAPTETATGSPSPTPEGTTTPGSAQPPPNQGGGTTPPTTSPNAPAIELASSQKGTRVRGTVTLAQGSRLEVTAKLHKRRVGRFVKTAGGTTTFSVTVDAKARKELKRKRSLKLSVDVAITQPGAAKQRRTFNVKLRS